MPMTRGYRALAGATTHPRPLQGGEPDKKVPSPGGVAEGRGGLV
jgi:hypothetical protein